MNKCLILTCLFSLLLFNLSKGQTLPGSDLVAYYPFNGNPNDMSSYEHHGVVNGATLTTDRHGNANSAYYFNGNDYINVTTTEHLNLETLIPRT